MGDGFRYVVPALVVVGIMMGLVLCGLGVAIAHIIAHLRWV